MKPLNRRAFLTHAAALGLVPALAGRNAFAQAAKPRLTLITQWHHGGDAVAISALGKAYEKAGGIFEHTAVPGFTTDMLNKLRAQIIAGDPPSVSQLKGPEIAAWSTLAPTVDLDALVKEAGFAAAIAPDLAKQQMPKGQWIALPLQIHRVNTMWISKKAMDKVGESRLPTTWPEFDALAAKMKAAGIVPIANGGRRDDDGIKFDVALAGTSPETYRKAIMELDRASLGGPEMVAAFERLRTISEGLTPDVGSTDWVDYIGAFMRGEKGILFQGTWAQSFIASQGFNTGDYLVGPAPQAEGVPAFVLNSDSFMFWKRPEPDIVAGQQLFAKLVMSKEGQQVFPKVSGAMPARSDIDLSGPDWSDGQRNMVSSLAAAKGANRVVLTLSQNMAQTNDITSAMMDVITEFVHDRTMPAKEGAQRLAESIG